MSVTTAMRNLLVPLYSIGTVPERGVGAWSCHVFVARDTAVGPHLTVLRVTGTVRRVDSELRICNIVYTVLFRWDEQKNHSNRRNHGISFDTAARVFLDPLHMSRQDRVVDGEGRWQTIGRVNDVLILVAYTVVDEEHEIIRIISARKATRREQIEYEEGKET
jgi:uncharacterized protein